MNNRKLLELQACKVFVCPNLSLLDEKGKVLNLSEKTIEKSRKIANEYFKLTYHKPKYTKVKSLLPVFTYISAILCGERKTQREVLDAYGANGSTFRKWYLQIADTLNYDIQLFD